MSAIKCTVDIVDGKDLYVTLETDGKLYMIPARVWELMDHSIDKHSDYFYVDNHFTINVINGIVSIVSNSSKLLVSHNILKDANRILAIQSGAINSS